MTRYDTWLGFDTEDNSPELFEQFPALSIGYNKRLTQITSRNSNGDKFHSDGSSPDAFLSWLRGQKKCVAFAHNLQYDLGNLFRRKLDTIDITMIGGRLIKAQWRNVTFRDSFNIWPMSLARLGAKFELEKGELDARSRAYAERDVDILMAAMDYALEFATEHADGHLPATLGGLSVRVWRAQGGRNWFCDMPVAREALYGGRVELFSQGGHGNIFLTDINSLYPSCMLLPFPGPIERRKVLGDLFLTAYGIADVTVHIPEDSPYGVLPYRRRDGRVLYPVGVFRGTWTIAELRYMQDHHLGTIKKVHRCFGTNQADRYYCRTIDKLYERRLHSTAECEREMLKLLMNNLYGQLGMSGMVTRSCLITEKHYKSQEIPGVPYGCKFLHTYRLPLPEHTNWLHAAYVTAYGRIDLLEHIRKVKPENLIYCDTDSLVFFHPSFDPLPFPISSKLGEMKLEHQADYCETWSPKMYRLDDVYKAKGVPRKLARQFCEEGSASYTAPFKLRESIAFYDRADAKPLSVWRKIDKVRRSIYDVKRFTKGHWFPLVLPQT